MKASRQTHYMANQTKKYMHVSFTREAGTNYVPMGRASFGSNTGHPGQYRTVGNPICMFTSDACHSPRLLYILSFGRCSQDMALAGFILTTKCVSDPDFEMTIFMAVSSIVTDKCQQLTQILDVFH